MAKNMHCFLSFSGFADAYWDMCNVAGNHSGKLMIITIIAIIELHNYDIYIYIYIYIYILGLGIG